MGFELVTAGDAFADGPLEPVRNGSAVASPAQLMPISQGLLRHDAL